jgi:pimeloyl-ACP methyl ester carboxylesterase
MAPGLAVTKEAGTDLIAAGFHKAGYSVLAFEYRCVGESGGEPRQLAKFSDQLDDWQAALRFAQTLPEIDPRRIAIWGFSSSGGHVYTVAGRNPGLAAAISHAGAADAFSAALKAAPSFTPAALFKLNALAVADLASRAFGGEGRRVPLCGRRGEVAAITTPDSLNSLRGLDPGDAMFPREVSAWSAVRIGFYRPGRHADRISIPLLVLEFQDDQVTPPGPAAHAAERAPRGELAKFPGGHYSAMIDQYEPVMQTMLDFLERHLLNGNRQLLASSATARAAERQ